MSNSLIKVRWEGNFSKKFDGKTNLVERKYVIHGAIEKGESIVVQQKKGGKTWKGVVLRTQSESSDDSDSDGSVEVPFFPKRGINEAGITPTRKDVKLKCLNYPRELKPRRLNKEQNYEDDDYRDTAIQQSGTVLISDGATSMSTMVPLSPGSDGDLFDVLAYAENDHCTSANGILMNKDSTQIQRAGETTPPRMLRRAGLPDTPDWKGATP